MTQRKVGGAHIVDSDHPAIDMGSTCWGSNTCDGGRGGAVDALECGCGKD